MITGPRRKVGNDLENRRVERLADKLTHELRARGQLLVRTEDLDNVDRWRRAVRHAARRLGWHVRTGISGTVAWAVVEDWPQRAGSDGTVRLATRAILDFPPRQQG
jgi:hypothetical protein